MLNSVLIKLVMIRLVSVWRGWAGCWQVAVPEREASGFPHSEFRFNFGC